MKQVLNILLNMQDDQEIAALLPISLKSLGKFNSVRDLIDELLQSSKDVFQRQFSDVPSQVLALSQLASTRRNPWSSAGYRKRRKRLS